MLGKKLNEAMNSQMNKEFFAAYSYLSTASFFEEQELNGFAKFFRIQSQEEVTHAMKIFDYLHQVGGNTVLASIAAPQKDYSSPLAALESSLESERKLAGDIAGLFALATSERHAPTQVFLQWFINEQVEEEALFTRCIKRLKMVGKDANGLLILDREFGERAPDAPAAAV